MGHDKLRKFAENESFSCLLQPDSRELLADGYANLRDHGIKGRWNTGMFPRSAAPADSGLVLELGCGKGEYTIDLALRNPERNYVGVDIKGARLWKGAKYATQNDLPNVAFLRTRVLGNLADFLGSAVQEREFPPEFAALPRALPLFPAPRRHGPSEDGLPFPA